MERWKRRSIDLLTSIALGGREEVGVVPYYPQKTIVGGIEPKYFRRSIPERQGISSRRIFAMLSELERERRANVHGITLLRGGEVICECYAPGYDAGRWHISHSMTKSLTGMVIGALIDRGMLSVESRPADLFPDVGYRDRRFPLITVDHLLSMTAGVEFAEAGSITESGWTEAFFSSPIRFSPGTRFMYNSMNSYVLGRIAERVGGRGLSTLAEELIFHPLGIESYLWEKGPEGSEKGGWGLYLSPESWVKIGAMLLGGGELGGRRILSEKWVKEFTTVRAEPPYEIGGFNYGYHCWISREGGEILFNGMLGQNLWICPKNEMVVLMNSGNEELFQASPALAIIRKYLGGRMDDSLDARDSRLIYEKQADFFASRRHVRPLEVPRGLAYTLGLKKREGFDRSWTELLGSYALSDNQASLMPLVLRAMQNSMRCRLEEIEFSREGEGLIMTLLESGEVLRISVGLYRHLRCEINIRGEKYILSSVGRALGDGVYRIEIIFSETASVRLMTVKLVGKGRITVELGETPGERIAENYIKEYSRENRHFAVAVDIIERRFGKGTLKGVIHKSFNPTLVGADRSYRSWQSIVAEENTRIKEESSRIKFIRTVVDKLFGEP